MHEHLKEIESFVTAATPVIWVETYEERRLLQLIKDYNTEIGFGVLTWDGLNGVKTLYERVPAGPSLYGEWDDPVSAIKSFSQIGTQGYILLMLDMHKYTSNIAVVRAMKDFIASEPEQRHIMCVSHENKIPPELEKDVLLAHLRLPNQEDIIAIAQSIISENELDVPIDSKDIAGALGLTFQEVQSACSLALVKTDKLDRQELEKFKLRAVEKSGMMEIFPAVDESELGGLDLLKSYMRQRSAGFDDENMPTPTGILLMGLPGGGKSLSAKVIASILKMPLIKLDIASLKSKYVGESESKMGQALKLIDAISPAVVWLDK